MVTWNYRVIAKKCPKSALVTYQIHEVYYTEDGGIDCWTQQPVEPLGSSEAHLRNDLHAFLAAFRNPVLEEKMVLGQLQLVDEKQGAKVGEDLLLDYKGRVNRASGYIFQMLGNHLLLKQDPALRSAYDRFDQALAELNDALGAEPRAEARVGSQQIR
jgi:CRISPR/Cas system-associated exonuclease Cas4 (RecB family)